MTTADIAEDLVALCAEGKFDKVGSMDERGLSTVRYGKIVEESYFQP